MLKFWNPNSGLLGGILIGVALFLISAIVFQLILWMEFM